ncbi:MAG: endonuclease III domain-containing protein [Candidatus Limnocylindrales bacterium]
MTPAASRSTPAGRAAPSEAALARRAASPSPTGSLERDRPGLVGFVLEALRDLYGLPEWQPRRGATDELVLTILSQHTSDRNAERAFDSLVARFGDWDAVAHAPVQEVAATIVSGGLAQQKAPRIQGVLRRIRDERGEYDLGFLAQMQPRAARDWLVRLDGVGPKTASVVLLFCFGLPLMPVDTHVHRVIGRIGLVPPRTPAGRAHDLALEIFPPARMYEAHVNLITHGRRTCTARRPACGRCPIAPRCRYVDPRAP